MDPMGVAVDPKHHVGITVDTTEVNETKTSETKVRKHSH